MIRFFSVFHCNLMYSSIEEDLHAEVVSRCYGPLLRHARSTGIPLGIEATGLTLELIQAVAPWWLDELRRTLDDGLVEFVGSGYAQLIGPLCPANVNRANLRLGMGVYERLLGCKPRLALVNEQAYAAGLVPLYAEAGYSAIMMDYENPASRHSEWPAGTAFHPHYAMGPAGMECEAAGRIPMLWSRSIAFQKLQRLGHGEITLDEYLAWLDGVLAEAGQTAGEEDGCMALYGNDAEVFGFRPGRYATEAPPVEDEWGLVFAGLSRAASAEGCAFVLPSQALEALQRSGKACGQELRLEDAAMPVPVKKQAKYNVTRWAVTGRDDFGVNTTCRRLARALEARAADDAAWRRLCRLWSSDFRTHITQSRWDGFLKDLRAFEVEELTQWEPTNSTPLRTVGPNAVVSSAAAPVAASGRFLTLAAGGAKAVLNSHKGLAVHELAFDAHGGKAIVGTVEHGWYQDIELGADFFTGHLVLEGVGRSKVTDLERGEPVVAETDEAVTASVTLATPVGHLEKWVALAKNKPALSVRYRLREWLLPPGRLRLGHVTFLPWNINLAQLFYRTQNGGAPETLRIEPAMAFDHGRNISFLVSAGQGAGMTGGWWEAGDDKRAVRVSVLDPDQAVTLLAAYRPARPGCFFRLAHSVLEMDETSRPCEVRRSIDIGFVIEPGRSGRL